MKTIFYFFIFIFLAAAILFGVGVYLSPEDTLENADAIVVISGGETSRRVDLGVDLYKEGWAKKIIFSGAAAAGSVSNAKSMSRYAQNKGVSGDDIYLEENAKDTYENGRESAKIIKSNSFRSIILVTSPYHERRAGIVFKHFLGGDIKIIRRPAFDSRWRKKTWFLSGYGRERTREELFGLVYFYTIQSAPK